MGIAVDTPFLRLDWEQVGALVCFGIAVALFVRAAWLIRKDHILRAAGRRAEGRVARVIEKYESQKLVVRFADEKGGLHDFTTDLAQAEDAYAVGASVPVLYDPRHPQRAHLVQPISRAFSCGVLLLSAVSIAYIGVMMWRSPF